VELDERYSQNIRRRVRRSWVDVRAPPVSFGSGQMRSNTKRSVDVTCELLKSIPDLLLLLPKLLPHLVLVLKLFQRRADICKPNIVD
jgi:hypothetical protein